MPPGRIVTPGDRHVDCRTGHGFKDFHHAGGKAGKAQ
jgi:hypothetical protein